MSAKKRPCDGRIIIAIPDTPPSLNRWMSKHWRVRHREKGEWEQRIRLELLKWKLPKNCDRIECEVTMRFPDARKRDTDNHTATLSKALGDALRPDWIADDDSQRYWVKSACIAQEKGPKQTLIAFDYFLAFCPECEGLA